jgi:hypothetical protein
MNSYYDGAEDVKILIGFGMAPITDGIIWAIPLTPLRSMFSSEILKSGSY